MEPLSSSLNSLSDVDSRLSDDSSTNANIDLQPRKSIKRTAYVSNQPNKKAKLSGEPSQPKFHPKSPPLSDDEGFYAEIQNQLKEQKSPAIVKPIPKSEPAKKPASKGKRSWTAHQLSQLENALHCVDPCDPARWKEIAELVDDKTPMECFDRINGPYNSPKKHNKKKLKTPFSPLQVDTRMGTLKSRKRLRAILGQIKEAHQDDAYEAIHTSPSKLANMVGTSTSDDSDDDTFIPAALPAVSAPDDGDLSDDESQEHTEYVEDIRRVNRDLFDRYIARFGKGVTFAAKIASAIQAQKRSQKRQVDASHINALQQFSKLVQKTDERNELLMELEDDGGDDYVSEDMEALEDVENLEKIARLVDV